MSVDPVALVRSRLEELGSQIVGDRGDRFMARCPAHDDRSPSLHVSTGEDGRALLHCHAGCDLAAILDASGLTWDDLFIERRGRDISSAFPGLSKLYGSSSTSSLTSKRGSGSGSGSGQVPLKTGREDPGDVLLAKRVKDVEDDREQVPEVRLAMDRIPANAYAVRSLAERVAIVFGCYVSDGDVDRGGPLSVGLIARLEGRDPHRAADRKLAWVRRSKLVEHCVIRWRGRLENGTDCFEPAEYDLASLLGVEPREVVQEPEPQPVVEVDEETSVNVAEVGERGREADASGVIAPPHGAPAEGGTGSSLHEFSLISLGHSRERTAGSSCCQRCGGPEVSRVGRRGLRLCEDCFQALRLEVRRLIESARQKPTLADCTDLELLALAGPGATIEPLP